MCKKLDEVHSYKLLTEVWTELKRVENIKTPDDFNRKIELKPDYGIDIRKSSYEDWLKEEGLTVNTSSTNEQNDDLSVSKEEVF